MLDLTLVAAVAKNADTGKYNVLGHNGKIPWIEAKRPYAKEDLQRFKKLTEGEIVVMGMGTYESLPASKRPLPNRTNIVLTRNKSMEFKIDGAILCDSLVRAREYARGCGRENIYVIGGASVFKQAMRLATRMELTKVHEEFIGDAFFPDYSGMEWKLTNKDDTEGITFESYRRSSAFGGII